jgi:hypothetical protein
MLPAGLAADGRIQQISLQPVDIVPASWTNFPHPISAVPLRPVAFAHGGRLVLADPAMAARRDARRDGGRASGTSRPAAGSAAKGAVSRRVPGRERARRRAAHAIARASIEHR